MLALLLCEYQRCLEQHSKVRAPPVWAHVRWWVPIPLAHDQEKSHCAKVTLELLPVDMLGENRRRVIFTGPLSENNISGSQSLLDPEVGGMHMPDVSQPTALARADGCGGVCTHLEAEFYAEVLRDALEPEAMAGPTANTRECSFRAR